MDDNLGVEFLGYISDEKKHELLRESAALVLVSKEEGFGFPLLQAFQAGCPVVCSDLPVLHEVGGDSVLYADAHDAKAFAKHMIKLIEEPESAAVLTLKGKKRLEHFSWEKAAKTLAEEFYSS